MFSPQDFKRFLWRNGYLLIGAAWLLTLAFLVDHYWSYYSSDQRVVASIQQHLRERENKVQSIVLRNALINQLLRRSYDQHLLDELDPDRTGIYLFIFSDSWETFWNTNRINVPSSALQLSEGSYYLQNDRGSFELIKENLGGLYAGEKTLIALLPVYESYFKENKYLQASFWGEPQLPPHLYTITRSPTSFPLYNREGKVLCYLDKQPSVTVHQQAMLSVLLKVLAWICVGIFLNLFASFLSAYGKRWHGLIFLIAVVLLLRIISYLFPFPFHYREFGLFNAQVYASSTVLKSLGDVLINAILLVWIILFFRSQYQKARLPDMNPVQTYGLAVVCSFALLYLAQLFSDLIRSLVIDSRISFDVTNFYSINNVYSLVGFITIGLIIYCFFFLSRTLNEFLSQLHQREFDRKYTLLGAIGLIWLLFHMNDPAIGYDLVLMLWAIFYIMMLDLIDYALQKKWILNPFVSWLLLLTLSTTAILIYFNNQREKDNRRLLALNLAKPQDPDTEYFLSDITSRIQRDTFIQQFFIAPTPVTKHILVNYLLNTYFNSFISKFDIHIYTFNAGYQPLFNNDTLSYSAIRSILLLKARPIAGNETDQQSAKLFYYETGYNHYHYFGEKIISQDTNPIQPGGYLFYELTPKTQKNLAIFPVLLSSDDNQPQVNMGDYSYAVYENNILVYHYNDIPFPVSISPADIPLTEYEFRNEGGYSQLWYKAGNNRLIVVSKRNRAFIEFVTLVAYLFLIFLILAGLYRILYLLVKAGMKWDHLRNYMRITLRTQIQFVIIFTVVFSFIILGISTISLFIDRYHKNQQDQLTKNLNVLTQDIREIFDQHHLLSRPDSTFLLTESPDDPIIRQQIFKVADIHGVDVNLYDIDGNIQLSTEQLLFDRNLLSSKMNPEAYYQLHVQNMVQYIHPEHIGKLYFLSGYVPILNQAGEAIFYLNIPFFASQRELNQEISNFLMALINLNAFMFLLSGLLALFITRYVTGSFTFIAEKMKNIRLNKTNEQIVWNRNDEIGMLVKEFNQMVRQLEKSAEALARSERELAWREMARQVAHEIKNPLTPMKLSLQHLQRAIREHAPNVEELTLRTTHMLVEQIEHLALIASDFSAFARISGDHKELFLLNEVLDSVIHLYQNDEHHLLIYDAPEKNYWMEADKTAINRLFNNLLQNAFQAIPEHKKGVIEVAIKDYDGKVCVMIKDNGTGIPDELKSKIFFPNFTTKSSGTGLGLAMCKRIVEQWNGRIWFESQWQQGTTFYVELPLADLSAYNGNMPND
ncbi:HAMP domain-containing protein [Thermoflavifilum aggregans]|uniref:histidine kinase n=1 Tax=Thermoflavifilum aggregans TaxID=454188 RepID=A0A2M9CVE5_9BACT|nr:ATP-binding protein [Thermoflavifilum aggregans]PJJ75881.1 HAMP domain-containing protein [Thermoflavifilum aggregans]